METISISELKEKTIDDLTKVAKELSVEGAAGLRKQDLIFAILKTQTENRGRIFAEGDMGPGKYEDSVVSLAA